MRDARSRLLADDLVHLQSALAQDVADESALKARRAVVGQELDLGRQRQAGLEQLAAEATPALNAARDTWYSALRGPGTAALPGRARRGAAPAAGNRGYRPGLRPRPGQARPAGRRRPGRTGGAGTPDRRAGGAALAAATAAKQDAENAAAAEDKRLAALLRAAADRREGLAKLAGQVGAARIPGSNRPRPKSAASGNPLQVRGRNAAGRPRASSPRLNPRWLVWRTARKPSTPTTRTPARPLTPSPPRSRALETAERDGERERGALLARRDALQLGLNRKDGTGHVLGAGGLPGVLESLRRHDLGGTRLSRPPSRPPWARPPTPWWSRTPRRRPPPCSG